MLGENAREALISVSARSPSACRLTNEEKRRCASLVVLKNAEEISPRGGVLRDGHWRFLRPRKVA